jgi:glycosyltransferase involved in cell wall biosynthesis
MRILIINSDSQPQFIGGIKRVNATLAHAWQDAGHEVCFLGMGPRSSQYHQVDGIPQRLFPNPDGMDSEENIQWLCQQVTELKADVLLQPHVEDEPLTRLCVQAKEQTGVALVAACHFAPTHDMDIVRCFFDCSLDKKTPAYFIRLWVQKMNWFLRQQSRIRKNLEWRYTFVLEHADKMIALSAGYVDDIDRLSGHRYQRKLAFINNPYPFSFSTNAEKKSEDSKRVLWCGRVEYGTKRTDRILGVWSKLWKRFPDWELIIMGGGDLSCFESLAKQHHIQQVRFVGFCDPHEWYEKGRVLCVTSSAEGWPMTLMEAMAEGCATMAYGSFSSVKDIIADGETGYIIPPFDEDLFAERLGQLMADEALCARMGQAGRERMKHFCPSAVANQYIQVFSKLLNL